MTSISGEDASDRLAIRELIDAYAHCADRRDADGQKALFTTDTRFLVHMGGEGTDPTDDVRGRESLTPVFENLNTYEVTTHFNGQSTVTLDGNRATGETYCLAHHLYTADGERKLMIALAYRYGAPTGPEPYRPSRFAFGTRKLRTRSASARCVTGERSAVMSWATNYPKNGHTAGT